MRQIKSICERCERAETCWHMDGCKQWKAWFALYWRSLRKKYIGKV